MGRAFYRFSEAAARLGCSKRSIHNYTKKGFLRKFVVDDGSVVIDRGDVDQLAADRGTDFPAMNRTTFLELQRRLKKLEDEMVTVKHILQIRDDQLRISPHIAEGFFKAALDSFQSTGRWEQKEVEMWAEHFERMDEVTMETIAKATLRQDCWVPFFRLCIALQEYAASKYVEKPDIVWQALHKKLDEGRKKLRAVAILWMEMGKGTLPETFIRALEDPKEALFQSLARKGAKAGNNLG